MKAMKMKKSGMAFVLVIAILAVILIAVLFFSRASIEHGRHTSFSLLGLQANCLAEAAVERALRVIHDELNNSVIFDNEKGNPNSLGVALRLPLKNTGKEIKGQNDNLGKDELLDTSGQKPILLNLKQLRLKPEGEDELDKLVNYMSQGSSVGYGATVTIKIDRAFRVGPPKDLNDYKVPGLEIAWNIRADVKDFLEGKGYLGLFLKFPPGMKIFDFSLKISFAGITFASIDVVTIVDKAITWTLENLRLTENIDEFLGRKRDSEGNKEGILTRLCSIDFYADKIINKLLLKGQSPPAYPIQIFLDSELFPRSISELWPPGLFAEEPSGGQIYEQYLEKYGELKITCEAEITTQDGHTTKRRIEGVKEFRVADVEPPAPMYSLFIGNHANQFLYFDYVGGDFYVNNQDFTEMLGKFKNSVKSMVKKTVGLENPSEKKAEDPNNPKEIPGLIRVNFIGTEKEKRPLVVNATLFGNPSAGVDSPIDPEDGFLKSLLRGIDALLVLNGSADITLTGAGGTVNAEYKKRGPTSGEKVPSKLSWGELRKNVKIESSVEYKGYIKIKPKDQEKAREANQEKEKKEEPNPTPLKERLEDLVKRENYSKKGREAYKSKVMANVPEAQKKFDDWYERNSKRWGRFTRLNFVPNIPDMSCSPIDLAITLVAKPLKEKYLDFDSPDYGISLLPLPDCFQAWEWPYFGTGNRIGTIPLPAWQKGTTHFFGMGALHPTLTRELEGKVLKQFRQWKMCIVGLNPLHRIPIPWPPFLLPPPPIIIPVWYTNTIQNKYGYNFGPLKSYNTSAESDDEFLVEDVGEYDPDMLENRAPNLYTTQQYVKKAAHFYSSYEEFIKDLPNRTVELPSGTALLLDGITYIAGSLGTPGEPFNPEIIQTGPGTKEKNVLFVVGKGMIIVSGNVFLGCSLKTLDFTDPETGNPERTVFTLMACEGGLMVCKDKTGGKTFCTIEGSVCTDKGLFVPKGASLHILGNWVTNYFNKPSMEGTVVIDYVSSRVRNSLGSIHPERGKFEPRRYYVTIGPTWLSWRAF